MYLDNAIGSIQPGGDHMKMVDRLEKLLLSNKLYVDVPSAIPSACIDGRPGATLRPNSAGGTNTLAVGLDLVRPSQQPYLEQYRDVLSILKKEGLPVGGHVDTHADEQKSGCGACDKLQAVYAFIVENGSVLRDAAAALDVAVTDADHKLIIKNASARADFASGAQIKNALADVGGTIDELSGDHREIIIVINTRASSTLDRSLMSQHLDTHVVQAFNLDIWSLELAAKELSSLASFEQRLIFTAMLYYNLAVAHVLCGPRMQVVIR